ncbi:unnamed protein product [Phytophthora fragariaefolia]|uniref:Unnamed protein product n=1 Tax=Phytophthora fragariaefolia TaxID=1490495 RepID=A0A9W6XHV2_9STRA|nr:unnamed protein product [Phytophthora fragariaefolia]
MLTPHAFKKLTRALNASFPREQPWTETQVTVKYKNLRSEYLELQWLRAQPGFAPDGRGLGPDWWLDVKTRRPKAHAFKDKLPWIFESRLQAILDDDDGSAAPPQPRRVTIKRQQEEPTEQTGGGAAAAERPVAATETHEQLQPREEVEAPTRALPPKRKRGANAPAGGEPDRDESSRDQQQADEYSHSLSRSVEQSAAAAAGMTRGFQDLITMFQEQSARCRALEQELARRGTDAPSVALAEQRSVLLALARSLEQSTRATADMAQGYRELVTAFVRETDSCRLQR